MMTTARRFFVAFALVVVLCLVALFYVSPRTVTNLTEYAFTGPIAGQQRTILYWNSFFSQEDFYMGEGHLASHCPKYRNCYATRSRFLQNVENYDAIVFHGINNQLDDKDLPAQRRPEQRYVFVSLESPANRYVTDEFDGYFNVTMTYHMDSDVVWTYADIVSKYENLSAVPQSGGFEWPADFEGARSAEEERRLDKLIRGKRKLAVWYRSNCETRSGREKYVNELERHAHVDKYGACSDQPGCPKGQDCFSTDVEPNYFFYLSFENSLCVDYVTEKFFNALKYDVVPVVYGGADYSRFAPPKSYINALDFDTPKHLAEYLKKLSRNATEYKKYFDWKKQYQVVDPTQRIICDLCEILNGDQKKTYPISKWYSTTRCPLQRKLDKQRSSGGENYATKRTLLSRNPQ